MSIHAALLLAFVTCAALSATLACSSSDDVLPPLLAAGTAGAGGSGGGSAGSGGASAGGKTGGGANAGEGGEATTSEIAADAGAGGV
jgi:hypothetical protein